MVKSKTRGGAGLEGSTVGVPTVVEPAAVVEPAESVAESVAIKYTMPISKEQAEQCFHDMYRPSIISSKSYNDKDLKPLIDGLNAYKSTDVGSGKSGAMTASFSSENPGEIISLKSESPAPGNVFMKVYPFRSERLGLNGLKKLKSEKNTTEKIAEIDGSIGTNKELKQLFNSNFVRDTRDPLLSVMVHNGAMVDGESIAPIVYDCGVLLYNRSSKSYMMPGVKFFDPGFSDLGRVTLGTDPTKEQISFTYNGNNGLLTREQLKEIVEIRMVKNRMMPKGTTFQGYIENNVNFSVVVDKDANIYAKDDNGLTIMDKKAEELNKVFAKYVVEGMDYDVKLYMTSENLVNQSAKPLLKYIIDDNDHEKCRKVVLAMAKSLQALHNSIKEGNVSIGCHRDLHTDNGIVVTDKNGNIKFKIIDFDLAVETFTGESKVCKRPNKFGLKNELVSPNFIAPTGRWYTDNNVKIWQLQGGGPFNLYDYKDKMAGTAPKMVKVGIHWSNADADLTQLITVLYAFCFKKGAKKEAGQFKIIQDILNGVRMTTVDYLKKDENEKNAMKTAFLDSAIEKLGIENALAPTNPVVAAPVPAPVPAAPVVAPVVAPAAPPAAVPGAAVPAAVPAAPAASADSKSWFGFGGKKLKTKKNRKRKTVRKRSNKSSRRRR